MTRLTRLPQRDTPRSGYTGSTAARALKPSRGLATLGTVLVWALILHLAVPLDILDRSRNLPGWVSEYETLTKFMKLTILLVALGCIASRLSLVKRLITEVNRPYLAFMILVLLSCIWSISPGDTFSRFMGVLTVTAVALAFNVTAWHPRQFQTALRSVITLLLCASLVFGILEPENAIEQGSWHGLATTKNWFGQMASFGLIFWLHGWLSKETSGLKAIIFGAVSAVCLHLSRSSTAMLATVFALVFLFMLLRTPAKIRRYMPHIVTVFAILVVTYALAVLRIVPGLDALLEPISAITGKDSTFTARSTIWEIIKDHIALNPLLGSGYGAYWTGPHPWSPSYVFIGKMYFYPTESHNGYLEMVNDLGFVGLGFLLAYMYVFTKQSLAVARIDKTQGALFLALFFEQAYNNLTESTWLDMNATFIFATMTLATVSMARALVDSRPAIARRPANAGFRLR